MPGAPSRGNELHVKSQSTISHALGNTSDMRRNMAARKEVMSWDHREEAALKRIKQCRHGRRCNHHSCYYCGTPPGKNGRGRTLTHHDWRPWLPDWVPVNAAPYETDLPDVARIRNFRNGGAQWIVDPFEGIPDEELFAVTVHHSVPTVHCDLKEQAQVDRPAFQGAIDQEFPNAIYRGQFEYVLRWTDDLTRMFDDEMLSSFVLGDLVQHVRAVLFHSHGLLHAPGFSKDQIRAGLQTHYVGPDGVCVRSITETFVDENGVERGGRWGWAQYASKEFVKLDFGDENVDAFQEILALERTWNRHSRKIKFGGPSKADFRPTWQPERLPTFEAMFSEVAHEEGWTDPDHPNFDLVAYTPGNEDVPMLTDVSLLPESPDEYPHYTVSGCDQPTEATVDSVNDDRRLACQPRIFILLKSMITTFRTLLTVWLGLSRQATSACLNEWIRATMPTPTVDGTNYSARLQGRGLFILLNSLVQIRGARISCTSMPRNNGPP